MHKGFTLAELLIALAILGVIATFTIPKVLQSSRTAQAQDALAMGAQLNQKYLFENGGCYSGDITCSINPTTGAALDGKRGNHAQDGQGNQEFGEGETFAHLYSPNSS